MEQLTPAGFLARFAAALALVLLSYNPSGYSFLHWCASIGGVQPLEVVAGLLLLGAGIFPRTQPGARSAASACCSRWRFAPRWSGYWCRGAGSACATGRPDLARARDAVAATRNRRLLVAAGSGSPGRSTSRRRITADGGTLRCRNEATDCAQDAHPGAPKLDRDMRKYFGRSRAETRVAAERARRLQFDQTKLRTFVICTTT